MKDTNGKRVGIGDKVVVLTGDERGQFGYVVKTAERWGGRSKPRAMVCDRRVKCILKESNWTWTAWLGSGEFAVVQAANESEQGTLARASGS